VHLLQDAALQVDLLVLRAAAGSNSAWAQQASQARQAAEQPRRDVAKRAREARQDAPPPVRLQLVSRRPALAAQVEQPAGELAV